MATLQAWKERLDLVLTLVMLLAAVLVISRFVPSATHTNPSHRGEPPVPTERISVTGLWSLGHNSAPIAVIVFSDFECPACARFAQTVVPVLTKEYVDTGRIQLFFWHRVLGSHKRARALAVASQCAGARGKFWAFHDLVFSEQSSLKNVALTAALERVGVSPSQRSECDLEGSDDVDRLNRKAIEMKVSGTPTVFVGSYDQNATVQVVQRFTGPQTPDELADAIMRLQQR